MVSRRPREHNLAASCDSGSDGSGFPAAWAGLSTPAGTCGASHARSCRRLLRDHVCVSRSQNAVNSGVSALGRDGRRRAVHLYTLSHVSSARVSIQHVLCFPFLSCSQNSVAASILYPDSERGAAQSSGRPARPVGRSAPRLVPRRGPRGGAGTPHAVRRSWHTRPLPAAATACMHVHAACGTCSARTREPKL